MLQQVTLGRARSIADSCDNCRHYRDTKSGLVKACQDVAKETGEPFIKIYITHVFENHVNKQHSRYK